MSFEEQYLSQVFNTINNGVKVSDERTGTGTVKTFGAVYRHDLSLGFPLLTTKRVSLKNIFTELKWMLNGDTNIKYLVDNGCHIWDEWADNNGDLPFVYGEQWVEWDDTREVLMSDWMNGIYDGKGYHHAGSSFDKNKIFIRRKINQVQNIIDGLKTNPNGRRHLLSGWNAGYIDDMALPPCHVLYNFVVTGNKLNCSLTMRSSDQGLGLPYNKASLAMFTMFMAQQTGFEPGEILILANDSHIYSNHLDDSMLPLQLTRTPKELPKLKIKKADSIFSYVWSDITLEDYDPHPPISMPVSV